MNEIPEVLKTVARKQIRYVLFRMKTGDTKDLTPTHEKIWNAVSEYYRSVPNFDGFENFNETWDIGTDDDTVLDNWDDPARSDTWWTWGISKFKAVKRVGLTYVINKEEGITKSFPGIMEYFVALGFAKPHAGSYKLDTKKMMTEVQHRDEWIPLIETDFSLKDAQEWQQHYYKYDIELKEQRRIN